MDTETKKNGVDLFEIFQEIIDHGSPAQKHEAVQICALFLSACTPGARMGQSFTALASGAEEN